MRYPLIYLQTAWSHLATSRNEKRAKYFLIKTCYSAVSIATRLRTVRPGFDSRQGPGFFLLATGVQTGSGAHPASCLHWNTDLFHNKSRQRTAACVGCWLQSLHTCVTSTESQHLSAVKWVNQLYVALSLSASGDGDDAVKYTEKTGLEAIRPCRFLDQLPFLELQAWLLLSALCLASSFTRILFRALLPPNGCQE